MVMQMISEVFKSRDLCLSARRYLDELIVVFPLVSWREVMMKERLNGTQIYCSRIEG
jgi:hypothetical protein